MNPLAVICELLLVQLGFFISLSRAGSPSDPGLRSQNPGVNPEVEGELPSSAWPHLPRYYHLPSLREQADIQDAWTAERRANIPALLRKYGLDAWLISQREYAEDTVFWSLKSAKQFSARRRTLTLFLANPSAGSAASHTWIDNTPSVWDSVRTVLEENDPGKIAVNTHAQIAFSSGMHAGELTAVTEGLGKEWSQRFVDEPMLAVEYIATMPTDRALWYRKLQSTAWAMISEGFSERVITPGQTTTTDVEWWLRSKIQQMNYTTWFHPDVTIIDSNSSIGALDNDLLQKADKVIQYGDFLHVDFGVTALGMNTDTQHLGYVLFPGQTEADVPLGLQEGLRKGNRLQDIVKENMKLGMTGNEILKQSLAQMRSEGIDGKIYCHPIGDWGHSAGTLIGMTNLQDGVPDLGDLPLLPNMFYSVELLVRHFVPERNATLVFPLEEDIRFVSDTSDAGGFWLWASPYQRQEKFHVVKTPSSAADQAHKEIVAASAGGDL